MVLETNWPVLARHGREAGWLQVWTDRGRAPRTIEAYARGLVEYLVMCQLEGIDPSPRTGLSSPFTFAKRSNDDYRTICGCH